MNLNRIICKLVGHYWLSLTGYPVHGWHDEPYPDSFCGRCNVEGSEV